MRRILFIAWWSLLGSAGIVALAEYLQPATFSNAVFPILLGLACVFGALAGWNVRYE